MDTNLQSEQALPLQLAGEGGPVISPSKPKWLSGERLVDWFYNVVIAMMALAVLALLLMAIGALYQFFHARADARRFPQEGRSVDVGGYTLNINCTGQGGPTFVLEAGLGVSAISWRAVQPEIAKFTRVCSYDRAGYDWSDPGPMPRTTAEIVKELHTLLQKAGEKPPYVLVGHSFGGTYVRVYNGQYPGEVAGMVLADTSPEDMSFPEGLQNLFNAELRWRQHNRKWALPFHRFGISRFLDGDEIDSPDLTYYQQESGFFMIQPGFATAAASEMENLEEGKVELRAAGTLGDKPLVVLIVGKSLLDLPVPPEEKAAVNLSWIESQKSLAGLSSRGKWVIVPGAGHMLPIERPDTIVSAAREVFADTKLH